MKEDTNWKKVGCGCLTFLPMFIVLSLKIAGELEGFWGTLLVFLVMGLSFIVGAAITGGFD